ncbi:MAG: hypothetical protein AAFY60_06020, partial [Myxococcota bacterium]
MRFAVSFLVLAFCVPVAAQTTNKAEARQNRKEMRDDARDLSRLKKLREAVSSLSTDSSPEKLAKVDAAMAKIFAAEKSEGAVVLGATLSLK